VVNGSGSSPGNESDTDYMWVAGTGGVSGAAGTAGYVIVSY
jgi:hypothetical protein